MAHNFQVLDRSGYTAKIYALPDDPPRICKAFNKDRVDDLFPVERTAYERFATRQHPSSILKYYGIHETIPAGLILELAANRNLEAYLWHQNQRGQAPPTKEDLYRWAWQASEALEFAHSVGVLNADIHCVNFVLDADLNLKVADWAGASIDGSISRSSYRLRYSLFDREGRVASRRPGITIETEIFALGTAIYRMAAGHEPWPELSEPEDDVEIKRRLTQKEFPDTGGLDVLGDVVLKCWLLEFTSMREVGVAVEAERQLYKTHSSQDGLHTSDNAHSSL